MAVVWLIVELIMVFFYFDLPNVMSKNDDELCVSTDSSVNNINGSYRKRSRYFEITSILVFYLLEE